MVVVLNSDAAVQAFSQGGNLTIGGTISATAGPVGTGAQLNAALQHPAPMFSYTRSTGLFAGVSIEGTILIERKETNKAFYGSAISASAILSGQIPPPDRANAMYEVIEAAEEVGAMMYERGEVQFDSGDWLDEEAPGQSHQPTKEQTADTVHGARSNIAEGSKD